MSLAIYPGFLSVSGRGLTYTVLRSPQMSTLVQDAPNGLEVRIQQYQQPKYNWSLTYDYIKNNPSDPPPSPFNNTTDMQALLGFFNSHYGMGASFLFNDSNFNAVTLGQLQVINDGSGHFYSPVQIHLGGKTATDQVYGFYEDITDLQPLGGADHSGLSIFDNGVLQPYGSAYTLAGPGLSIPGASFMGLYVNWTGTPSGPVTATFTYYYHVRFDMDDLGMEQFMALLWTIGGSGAKKGSGEVKLKTAWPASV